MFGIGKFLFATLLVAVSLCNGVYGEIVPAFVAPYAVAPFARSYSAHTVNHAVAAPAAPLVAAAPAAPVVAAAPATYPLPLPYVAPYYAAF